MMRLMFQTNDYQLIDIFRGFAKLFQMIHQLI